MEARAAYSVHRAPSCKDRERSLKGSSVSSLHLQGSVDGVLTMQAAKNNHTNHTKVKGVIPGKNLAKGLYCLGISMTPFFL